MKPLILLVDDDADFLESNKCMLEAFDYDVVTATNGTEAQEELAKNKPSLIVLDVMMRYDTEGLDISRSIKSQPETKDIPILLVSGIVTEKKLSKLPEADSQWLPVNRILEKPIEPSALIAEIEKQLAAAKNAD